LAESGPAFVGVGRLACEIIPDEDGSVAGIFVNEGASLRQEGLDLQGGMGMEPLEDVEEEDLRSGPFGVAADEYDGAG